MNEQIYGNLLKNDKILYLKNNLLNQDKSSLHQMKGGNNNNDTNAETEMKFKIEM